MNLILIGLVLVGLALIASWWRHFALAGDLRLPFELRRSELVFAERTFRATGRISLHARVDRAYRKPDGSYVLLELKTRGRHATYLSDVIELSVQRVALMSELGVPVCLHGYVVIQQRDGGPMKWMRVDLLEESAVQRLAYRRQEVLAGREQATLSGSPGMCRCCAYAESCPTASS